MTLDANIVIAYLNGDPIVIEQIVRWRKEGVTLFLSAAAEAEVLSFPALTATELQTTEHFLIENFISIPIDRSLARHAAALRRMLKIKLWDASIAATALVTHTPLVTRNVKDFRKVPGIRLMTI